MRESRVVLPFAHAVQLGRGTSAVPLADQVPTGHGWQSEPPKPARQAAGETTEGLTWLGLASDFCKELGGGSGAFLAPGVLVAWWAPAGHSHVAWSQDEYVVCIL